MISELLGTGIESARTARELATACKCDTRKISITVERERRQGKPICASCTGEHRGYYLAADAEELEDYCGSLYKRGGELFKTRRALIRTLEAIRDKREADNEIKRDIE